MKNLGFELARTSCVGALVIVVMASAGCSDDGGGSNDNSGGSAGKPSSGGSSSQSGTGTNEAVISACPDSSTLIETTEWMTCLEGKRLTGKEPFNGKPCELRIQADGAFEYVRDGAVAIAVPVRSEWEGASGLYQNTSMPARFFQASIAPDLKAVQGEPRVTRISVAIFPLAGMEDKVEVNYLDEALMRQTYNCTLDEK